MSLQPLPALNLGREAEERCGLCAAPGRRVRTGRWRQGLAGARSLFTGKESTKALAQSPARRHSRPPRGSGDALSMVGRVGGTLPLLLPQSLSHPSAHSSPL